MTVPDRAADASLGTAVQRSPIAPISREAGRSRNLMMVVIMLGHFLTVSSIGSLTVAIPTIQQDLDANASDLQWTLALYQIGYAVLLITAGRFGDVLGSRRVFIIGLALFAGASGLSAAAPSISFLIFTRLLQGIAGGLVAPQVLGMIQHAFLPHERAKPFSVFAMVSGAGFVTGQLLSGILIDANPFGLGWRSVFVLYVGVGALAVVGAVFVLPNPPPRGGSVDVIGVLQISAVGIGILYSVIQGPKVGWGLVHTLLLVTSLLGLALFVAHQKRRAARGSETLLDLAMFRKHSFRTGLILTIIFNFQAFGPFFLLTITFQLGFGLSPTAAAMMTAVTAIATIGASRLMVGYADRLGYRLFTISGVVGLAGAVSAVLAATIAQSPPDVLWFVPAMVLLGTFGGMFLPSVVRLTLSDVPNDRASSVSGVVQTVQQFAGAIGVAVFGAIFFSVLGDETSLDAYLNALSVAFGLAIFCCALLIAASLLTKDRPRASEAVSAPAAEM